MIWKRQTTLEQLNRLGEGNMVGLLDIRFETFTDDTLEATMPVDGRTQQPFGLLHGGASVVLARRWGRWRVICAAKANRRWWGWRLTPTTSVQRVGAGCGACAKRCTSGLAIRSGKLKSSTNSRDCAVHRG